MIVDVHTHPPKLRDPVPEDQAEYNAVWRPDRPVKTTTSWSDYLAAQGPAARSITFGIAWRPGDLALPARESAGHDWSDGNINDAVAEFARAHADRVIGFMALHPEDEDSLDELERCLELGLKGIKLGPNYQNYDPLGPAALALYAAAQRRRVPVLFHQGTSPTRDAPIRYAHPLLVDEVAIRYPDLKMVMAHLGHPWQVDTCVVIRKHPNVYADLSANFYRPFSFWEQMVKATEWKVLDKILFGTDYPVTEVQETIDHLRRVNDIVEGTPLPKVPLEAVEEIIHRDSLALLGLAD
ncbi:MAG: amidohydrolase family protein [Gemmatimonadota bacterium]